MDTLQKVFDEAVQQLASAVSSEEDLEKLVDAIPEKLTEMLSQLPDQVLASIKITAEQGLEERRMNHAEFVARNVARWKEGFDALELLLEIATEAGDSFSTRHRPDAAQRGDLTFDVVVRLHAKGCLISKEILALLKNGFADGAHARWRALHEISVTAMFLAKHGEAATQSYVDFEFVEAYRGASQHNRYASRINSPAFTVVEMANIKEQFDLMVEKHGDEFGKPYGWARKFIPKGNPTFFALEEEVGLDHWRPYYRWASQNIHANVKSIQSSLGLSEAKESMLQVGPSNSGMADPACSTAISLTGLTCAMLCLSANVDDLVSLKMLLALSDEVGETFIRCDGKTAISHD